MSSMEDVNKIQDREEFECFMCHCKEFVAHSVPAEMPPGYMTLCSSCTTEWLKRFQVKSMESKLIH